MKFKELKCPPNLRQVVSWAAFSVLNLACYLLFIPLHTAAMATFLTVVNSTLTALVFALGLLVSLVDPRDPLITQQQGAKETISEVSDHARACSVCTAYISEASSHCRECNVCVLALDHHCKWVNNCIGAANYVYFIVLLVALQAQLALHLALSIDACQRAFRSEDISSALFGLIEELPFGVLAVIIGAVNLGIFVANGHLILLHSWLKVQGITTYEWIKGKQQAYKLEALRRKPVAPLTSGGQDPEPDDRAHPEAFLDVTGAYTVTLPLSSSPVDGMKGFGSLN
jgi:palmitoyltransferase